MSADNLVCSPNASISALNRNKVKESKNGLKILRLRKLFSFLLHLKTVLFSLNRNETILYSTANNVGLIYQICGLQKI